MKIYKIERAHTTCNVAATVRCREGWEPGDNVYWAKTVWLRTRVRTKSVRLTLAPWHISMCMSGPQRVSQIPPWVTKLTMSTELDLFSHMGEYGQASLISVAVFSLLSAQKRRSEPTQVVRPLWAFVRGWSNLWQISNFSNWRRKRLQVGWSYGTPLRTSSMFEGNVPQEQMTKHIKIGCLFSFCKEGVRKLRNLVGMAKTKANTIKWWPPMARTSSIEQDTCATNKIGKS